MIGIMSRVVFTRCDTSDRSHAFLGKTGIVISIQDNLRKVLFDEDNFDDPIPFHSLDDSFWCTVDELQVIDEDIIDGKYSDNETQKALP